MNIQLLRNTLLVIVALSKLQISNTFAQATASNYTGENFGTWNIPTNWTPAGVPNNSGSATFDVTIDNKNITLDIDATISRLTMLGDSPFLSSTDHSLTSAATDTIGLSDFREIDFTANQTDVKLDLGNYAAFSGTTLHNTAKLFYLAAAAGRTAIWQFNGAHIVENDGRFSLGGAGTVKIVDENGTDALRDFTHNLVHGSIKVSNGLAYTFPNNIVNEGDLNCSPNGTMIFAQNLTQIGDLRDPAATGGFLTVTGNTSSGSAKAIINGLLTNYDPATRTLQSGRYNLECLTAGIGTIQVLGGDLLDIVHNDASIFLQGPGAAILDRNGADALRNLGTSTRSLRFQRRDFTTVGALSSGSDADKIALLAVRGDSHVTVAGDLTILGGGLEISPLTSYTPTGAKLNSLLKVGGNLTLAPEGYTRFEVFGPAAVGKIEVAGNSTFAGDLQIFVLPTAPLITSGSVTVLTTNGASGHFSNVASGGRVTAYKPTVLAFKGQFDGVIAGTVKATYDTASLVISDFQPHASMLNISTRLKVQTGDNALIGGFIVRGIGPKKMIMRGIGPSLSASGVPGALQDPTLELHDSSGAMILSNDNWQDTQAAVIQATGIPPGDLRESAIVATLNPGSYTAVLRGASNTAGVGLVEVYDLDTQPGASELVNIATRGRVEPGDNVMIGGYIVGAAEPAKLIVRGIGPSLAASNVPGSLQDPTLELHDASGATIMSNDNWQDDATQAGLIQSAGLAPTDPRESAVAVTLNPGSYTAIVRGKSETEGVALVEFYKLN
ncbi:MAG: hypothetical protein WAO00_06840 [Chthoniobacterales bacterium]